MRKGKTHVSRQAGSGFGGKERALTLESPRDEARAMRAIPCALLIAASASVFAGPLEFPKYGFSIDALEPESFENGANPLILCLPAKDNFAANVNVAVQPFTGTMKQYIEISKDQFRSAGMKILSEKNGSDTEWVCEYAGEMNGSALHWYARAVAKGKLVYLVTGTGLDADWKDQSAAIIKCVESFVAK